MLRIEDFYAAAQRAGLLASAQIAGQTIVVEFRSPDESVLDGLALSADYSIRFPASTLPSPSVGQVLTIGEHSYQVRDVRGIGDGSERRALLSRL